MKIAAIISEYNPFHKGHEYQIEETRSSGGATHIIALMSGNFVQRGYPAMVDKYRRAEMAVLGGADLVLELPGVYALASAEHFALGSVRILNALNGVSMLSFGTETGDLTNLTQVAHLLAEESEEFKIHLKYYLAKGFSFPQARNLAIAHVSPLKNLDFLKRPNNILALEYLKALIKTNSSIEPFTIKRKDTGYHSKSLDVGRFASATAIREGISSHQDVSPFLPEALGAYYQDLIHTDYNFVNSEDFREFLLYRLIADGYGLKNILDASEGLDQRIYNHMHILEESGLNAFIDSVKTKRYSHTRISRILMQFLLSFHEENMLSLLKTTPPTVKILGLNEKGREIIASLRKTQDITLQHNYKKILDDFQKIDARVSRIYGLKNKSYDCSWDYKGYKL